MKPVFSIIVVVSAVIAQADSIDTFASWHGWKVETGERAWAKKEDIKYPIWQMFDRDPKTAWVQTGVKSIAKDDYDKPRVELTFPRAINLDEIRLMNGYNKDEKTFTANSRITDIEILANGERIKATRLSDKMGWHTVSLPKRKYSNLTIRVRSVNHGSDRDIAISEISLLSKGKEVGPPKPTLVVASKGDECGCGKNAELLHTERGKVTATQGESSDLAGSSDGRYFAGVGITKSHKYELWIYDATLGRKIFTDSYGDDFTELNWVGHKLFGSKKLLWTPRKNNGPSSLSIAH